MPRFSPSTRVLALILAMLVLLGAAPVSLQAATYYWDQNSTSVGFGTAGGTWDTAVSSTWNETAVGDVGPIVSTNTATTDAVNFGTATAGLGAGTINVGTVDAGDITFGSASGAIVLSGGTITLAAASTITVNNTSDTISSILAGAGTSLTKAGTGTLILSNTNTYSGKTLISAGTVSIASDGNLGTAPGGVVADSINFTGSSTLQFTGTGNPTINSNRGITIGNTFTGTAQVVASANTVAYGGIVTGIVGTTFKKAGAGTLNLSGNSTSAFLGALNVDGGTLTLSGAGRIAGTSGVTIGNRATLTLDQTTNTADRIAGGITTSTGGTLNFTHAGAAATNYAEDVGLLTLTAGALTINGSQAAASQTSAVTLSQITRSAGGTLYFNGTGAGATNRNELLVTSLTGIPASGVIIPWAIVNDGTGVSFAQNTGAGTTLKRYTGTVVTTAPSTWLAATNARPAATGGTNNTAVSVNTITLDSGVDISGTAATALSADRTITMSGAGGGAILQTGGTSSVTNNAANSYVFAFGANEALFHVLGILDISTGTGAADTNLTGSGGLTKSGAGTLIIRGTSTITGTSRINEGIMEGRIAGSFGATSAMQLNGGTMRLSNDTGVTYTSNITVNADSTIQVDRVTAAATVTTQTIGTLTIGGGRVLSVNSNDITSGTAYGLTTGVLTLTSGGATIDVANNGAGTGTMTVAAPAGNFTLTKTGAGDLVTNSITTGFSGAVDIQAGRVGWSGASGTIAEAQMFSGAGGIIKSGAGTVTLSGTNTYGGITTISAGTLQVTNNSALGSSAGGTVVSPVVGAKLQLSGGVTIASETLGLTMFAPGLVASLENLSGTNAWNGTINVTGSVTNGDLVRIFSTAGTLTLGGQINLGVTTANAANQFVLQGDGAINVTGQITGVGALTMSNTGTGTRTLSNTANDYTGNTTVSGGTLKLGADNVIPSGTGKGDVTITSGPSVAGTLDLNGYDLAINGLNSITNTILGRIINNATGTNKTLTLGNNNASGSYAAIIADNTSGTGTVAVTKVGSGTQTLSGTNTYTGGTVISGGALTFLNTNAKSTTGTHAFAAATTLGLGVATSGSFYSATDITNAFAGTMTGNLSGITVTATTNVGIDTSAGDFTYSTAIAGSPTKGLVKLGTNTLTLSGSNTYTGVTTIAAGTLSVNTTDALGDSSATNTLIFSGGTLQAAAAITSISTRGVTLNGAGTIDTNGNAVSIAGIISGTGGLTKSGVGTLTLTGNNTHTGGTTVNAGILLLSGAVNMPSTGTLAVNNGGTFSLADGTARATTGATTGVGLTLATGSYLAFDWNGASLDSFTTTGTATSTGTVAININNTSPSGSGGTLITAATGSTLSTASYLLGNNTNYIATITAAATTVSIGAQTSVTALTDAYWLGGQVTGALGSMNLSSGSTSNWASTAAGASAGGVIPGGSAVNVIFSATGAAEQANVTIGLLDMNLGSITFNDNNAVTIAGSSNTITLNSTSSTAATSSGVGTTVTAGSAITVTGVAAGTNTISANLALGANQTWNIANLRTLIVSGIVSGAGSLTKAGAGTVTLTGTNTYSGSTTIAAGTLITNKSSALGDETQASNTLIFSGGTLRAGGAITSASTRGVILNSTGTIDTNSNTVSIAGIMSGTGGFTKSGTGTLVLNGTNTYAGNTIISGGTLQIGTNGTANGASLGSGTYAGTISLGATTANLDIQSDANQTLSGIISGTGALVKRYTGTLTLSGSNTYTGKTTLTGLTADGAGTLVVTSFNSVNGGAPLLASSSLGAPTTVGNGTINLGASTTQSTSDTLSYTGSGETTDRVINFINNNTSSTRTFDASGSGLIKFTSSATNVGSGTGNITLTGTGSGEFVGGVNFAFNNFIKSGAGTWTLGAAVNTATAVTNSISAGTLVFRAGGLNSTGATTISGASTAFLYNAASDAMLNIGGSLTLTGGASTTIGGSIGASATSARINVAGSGAATSTVKVNIYGISTVTPVTNNTYILLQSASGTLDGATYSLGTVFNATNFTVGATIGSSTTAVTADITAVTAPNAMYWQGTSTAGLTKIWAASNGSNDGNWSTTSGGSVQSLVPGSGADVFIPNISPTVTPTGTTLGSDMSIKSLTISDTTNGLGLNASAVDSYKLTIGTGGITMDASVPASSIAAPVGLGNNQTWTNNATTNTLTVSGPISGTGNLIIAGVGKVIFSGVNNYTGTTTVSNGTLQFANLASLYSKTTGSWTAANIKVGNGGTLALNIGGINEFTTSGTNHVATLLTNLGGLNGTSTTGFANGSTIGFDTTNASGGNSTVVNLIADSTGSGGGALGMTKLGTGTLTITFSNTYTGATTISAGTLRVGSSANIGSGVASNTLIFNGGTLQASNTITSTATRGVTLNSTGTIDTNGNAVSIAGIMSGTGGLTKIGTGTLTLSGTNTYAGNTLVSAGTLQFAKQTSLYNNGATPWTNTNINVESGATMAFNIGGSGEFTEANIITLLGLSNGANGFKTGSTVGLNTTSGDFTFSSVIANPNSGTNVLGLTKLGTNTLTLTGSNTYTGSTTIAAGTLNANTTDALGDSSSTNTLIFSGGTLQAGGTITSTSSRLVTLTSTGTIDTNSQAVSIAGIMSGTGGLTKVGNGTLTLSGSNTYTGATTVSVGTLHVSNTSGSATGTGAVTVSGTAATITGAGTADSPYVRSGTGVAVLSGTGTAGGSITLGTAGAPSTSFGVIKPGGNAGADNGTLTIGIGFSDTLTVTDLSQIQLGLTTSTQIDTTFDTSGLSALDYLDANGGKVGTAYTTIWNVKTFGGGVDSNYDTLVVRGDITLGTGGATLATIAAIDVGGTFTDGMIFKLIDWDSVGTAGSLSGGGSFVIGTDFVLPTQGSTVSWDISAFTKYGVVVAVVPEPGRMMLMFFGLAALFLRRRRK